MTMPRLARARSLRETTAEEIRTVLARRRMSGVHLAQLIGRSQSYVSRRLTGETPFDLDDVERIADALEVEVVDLLPRGVANARRTLGYQLPALSRPPDNRPRGPRPSPTRTRRIAR